MVSKVFVALAIIGFIGAAQAFFEQDAVLDKMVDDISAEYENSIARISQDSKIDMIAAEFEKQGFAPEVDRDLERFNKEVERKLSKKVSEAAKECLKGQHQKALGYAQEARAKVKACRDDKRDEFNQVRQNGLAAWREARENAEALRAQAKECVVTAADVDEARVCLKGVLQAAHEGAKDLAKALKETWSQLGNLVREVGKCARGALKEFRDNLVQVRKDCADCLKLTDN
ncbi:uncharacterized protein LOC113371658 [Ctenocephalides felis]|uniref:uncharacterized protein LOC113371658 n=1 Tax=Ctenocephalides felis TaxID=7515 RepID=UPI000E6E2F51|nr:uncharacterized protein LOC113371658 [Ctenocephalides felis]